jgi:hypothetical protein
MAEELELSKESLLAIELIKKGVSPAEAARLIVGVPADADVAAVADALAKEARDGAFYDRIRAEAQQRAEAKRPTGSSYKERLGLG